MLLYKRGMEEAVAAKHIKKVSSFDFSVNTTYGLGGKAAFAYLPKTVWQAKRAFDALNSSSKTYRILGLGSNVLVADKGIDGAVLSTKNLRGIVRLSENKLLCLSGTRISELLAYCKKHCLGGLEYLYGIPATVGGAA
ncbi:MAG: FAD-binding protein, partial [Clostridia bacterium]|nr:FAD-binding protein [Clostridia bacterium]